MKITDKLAKAEREGRPFWSFEFFPPRTAQGLQNLYDRIERMRDLGPEFIDITWGAGGKNADLTSNLVQVCQETIGLECCMHLCCTEMPKEKVEEALAQAKASGCQNILALRGDPPRGSSAWEPTADGFYRAADLVHYIHQHYPGDFCVAVAGFPQGHPETSDTDEGRHQEVMWLKEKVEAGAEFIFTQMFYDTDILFDWIRRVRDAGITVPIVPGIMPIQNWDKFQTWVKREKIVVPPHFYEALNPIVGDDEKVRAVGTKLVAEMCRKILGNEDIGIKGLHIYTLNLEKGARMLLQELQLEGRRESIAPFPWRPSLTPHRRSESIRPIFWANRVHSYLSRTDDWDEFPNGRWGDSRSPAYGDLDGYPVSIGISPTDAYSLWGHPSTFSDICHLFSLFCRGDLAKLPWSSQPPASETSVITDQLAKMNALGYLTINSQPAVDGVRSDDKVHGWGPPGGYVYQKAYLEFFVSPELLSPLIRRIERDPRITYYAVNKQGDLRTNTHSEGPNAVTWGVFPGKEIVQPTIVEAVSFIAWKDEAFELGLQWANLYPESSPSRRLIEDTMSTSYLVNIVANDFRDGQSIFQPFVLDQKMHNGTNGHESSETPSSQGVTVVLGAQWGDEGKGKLVDILAAEADICARCAGGNNAGHTIVVKGDKGEKKTYAFNLLPSGLINPKCIAYIGSGVVVHIPSLFNELDTLERKGLTCSDRLFISDRAHLVLGFHQIVDGLKEIELGGSSIGTTKKGIGPAYSSKASRSGLRVHHLYDPSFPAKFRKLVEGRFKRYGHFEFDTEGEIEMYLAFADRLRPHIVDGPTFMHSAVSSGKRILVEGANALMLDIDYGTYPFVTSSATSIGGVITGLGIPPMAIKRVLGVIKAYTTRVGGGPFPTEDLGTIGEILQEVGAEFGVVTGRRRRCGWLDLVVMRYSTMINGYTALNLTKLDVLDGFEEIKVATGYKIDGVDIDGFPADLDRLARVEVQYTTLPGWKTDISNCTQFDELPPNCGNYVHFIEEFLGVKVQFIGVGPARESTITVF